VAVRVLVVEDEDAIAEPLVEGLHREGYEVTRVATGQEALEAGETDVVLLDLRLPDIDGFTVCRELRARSDVPIIVVSARGEEVDRVVGLELGADDYVVKPYGLRELVARIRAVTRRREGAARRDVLRAGPLEVDERARRVSYGGRELQLTAKEFDLLRVLVREQGKVVSREQLMREIWDTSWFGSTKTLDMHISVLRRKLGDEATSPQYIATVRGVGFRFERPRPE
jgi:DNA-binding response OmpR family regulator